jgi:Na+/proline symporter
MIYRELEGGHLIGLEHEGAFLLICKQVLPSGLLGLILGGMIFATASSVTTTLNMSAAVFTNDIINRFKQHTSEGYLIKVARAATIVLGLLTVGVAFLVPRLGGIVEVVLSVGAITGAPLFAPPIWSLFSKRQTRSSIITATIIGLGINCFFKFLSPVLLNFSLDRAWEMAVGVLTPLVILTISELLLPPKGEIAPVPEEAGNIHVAASGNFLFLKVLGTALIITGLFITIIGVLTTGARVIVMTTGMIVVLPGIWFLVRYRASQRVNSR